MRKLIFNLHLYLALATGVLVAIFGVTGGIMAFEPELDRMLHAKLSYVSPGPHTLSLAELGAIVAKAFPGERIGGYVLSTSPGLSWQVLFRGKAVYVNPYTGDVLGAQAGGWDF